MERPSSLPKSAAPRSVLSPDVPVQASSFLEKRSYRRRRMTDALRLLPVFGLWLFMIPVFWPGSAEHLSGQPVTMSSALIYIFAVWICLIVICALLSFGQSRMVSDGPDAGRVGAAPSSAKDV